MSLAELRDDAVLRYVGYNAHPTGVTAVSVGKGKAALGRLVKAGLVKADEQWSGCLALTKAGAERLEAIDGGEPDVSR